MLEYNKRMQDFLAENGIICRVKYIAKGSMKKTWRLYNPKVKWSLALGKQLEDLGFKDYDNKNFTEFSGNGGGFCVFVRFPMEG
jgi:hypothetical protein